MKKLALNTRDLGIVCLVLCLSFGISLLLQYVFQVREHITTVFVFAVFLVSLVTRGYLWGIITSFIGTMAVNYAFTFPCFAINFAIPVNLISAVIMITVSLLTSALTTKLKAYEAAKAESEKEGMRANLLRAISSHGLAEEMSASSKPRPCWRSWLIPCWSSSASAMASSRC